MKIWKKVAYTIDILGIISSMFFISQGDSKSITLLLLWISMFIKDIVIFTNWEA